MNERLGYLRKKVLEEIGLEPLVAEEDIKSCIQRVLRREDYVHPMSFGEREDIEKYLYQSIHCNDVLQDLLDDDSVTEIMVNGYQNIFFERKGRLHSWSRVFASEDQLMELIWRIVGTYDRRVNASSPIVDTRLPDGSRVHIVLPPVSAIGPVMTIRKFANEGMSLRQLVEAETLPAWLGDYLFQAVKEGENIFIFGGTGSGKTTLLNALTEAIGDEERVITIEDSKELMLRHCRNWVSLECKVPNAQGEDEVNIRQLLRASLRMRPDRIIVGEVRGGECLDLLQALNTGHKGSLSTGHGNSCEDMLRRLETMALMGMELPLSAVRNQIVGGIHLLVHLKRDGLGKRKVFDVKRIKGIEDGEICLETIYG